MGTVDAAGRLSGADGPAVARRRAGLLICQACSSSWLSRCFPCPTSLFVPVSRVSGGEYLDAARMAGAGQWRTLKVILPLLVPAIALALLTTFAEVAGDFRDRDHHRAADEFRPDHLQYLRRAASYPVDFPAAGAQALALVLLVAGSIIATGSSGADKTTRAPRQRPQPLSHPLRPQALAAADAGPAVPARVRLGPASPFGHRGSAPSP